MINYEELKGMLERNRKIPYPEVPKLYPNPRYAKIIYDSFGGGKGELTAITQYIYEHINEKRDKNISEMLIKIAIEEMHHLNILGDIIINVGGKPIYQSSKDEVWSANNVEMREYSLKKFMEINCELEKEAIAEYQNLMKVTNNMQLRRVYDRILLDERTHLKIFEKILTNLDK